MTSVLQPQITAARVRDVLSSSLLTDGFDLVLDLERSRGARLVDERDGTAYLDMFGFFASSALGMNHPALADDAAFRRELATAAVNKPSNSDVYTVAMARFVLLFLVRIRHRRPVERLRVSAASQYSGARVQLRRGIRAYAVERGAWPAVG